MPTRKEIAEAAQRSLNAKWIPRSKGERVSQGCLLCDLYNSCKECPLHDKDILCCKEYNQWMTSNRGSKEEKQAAEALCERLRGIIKEYNVDAIRTDV